MGLGKSAQAAKYKIKHIPNKGPTIIICPKTIKYQWQNELKIHAGLYSDVLETMKPPRHLSGDKNGVYVINYDILGNPQKKIGTWVRKLKKLNPKYIVIDEVQRIKNPKAMRTKAVKFLCRKVPHIVGLGGTGGLENNPAELFTILNMLRPDVQEFKSFFSFAFMFCQPKRTPWGWQFPGAKNLDILNDLLNRYCMIRRLKKDVLKDLPPKTTTVIPMNLSSPKEYNEAVRDFLTWLAKKSKRKAQRARNAERVVKMGYLKRLAGTLKLKGVIEWIEDFLESGNKLIVFGIHKNMLRPIYEHFKKVAVLVDGSVTGLKRRNAIRRFNNRKECKLFIGNVHAAGEGWSCTSTSHVAFVELDWKPTTHNQAGDRIHGVGRGVKGQKAQIYFLVSRNTIESDLCEILQRKQGILDAILDRKSVQKSLDIFDQLETILTRRGRNARRSR